MAERVIPDLPNNSYTNKKPLKEPRVLDKAVSGLVITKEPGTFKKLFGMFVVGNFKNAIDYVLVDVIVPETKRIVMDAISSIGNTIFYDDSRRRSGYTRYEPRYTSVVNGPSRRDYRSSSESRNRTLSEKERSTHDFSGIIIENRGEAEDILNKLSEEIDAYGSATVANLYQLVGLQASFTDENWGWTDLRGARVRTVRGGHLLDLPRTEDLSNG